ncbi:MAG: hypothetical protein HKM03_10605 [Steroidobacteraceae bacterium]|nr:hypothetical protein [Steroidobacteraceae bacterium]
MPNFVPPAPVDPVDLKGFSGKMSERANEHFDIDDEFLGDNEESQEFDPVLERAERRPKAAPPGKRGKAAWSRVEDVLAERQLEKELRDTFEED